MTTTKAKAAPENKRRPWTAVLVWTLRVAVGALFMFSGFAKAVDVWGGIYKIEEYLAIWGWHLSRPVTTISSCMLALGEFGLGFSILTGSFRRVAPWCLAAFMAVMTPLTVWIYFADPVADCGCFGYALVISNGLTLAKNLVLCAAAAVLVIFSPRVPGLYIPRIQCWPLVATCAYAIFLMFTGLRYQPLYDFRPYPEGRTVGAKADSEPRYTYAKDGVSKSFAADSLPGDDWTFVAVEPGGQGNDDVFPAVYNADGEDVTAEIEEMAQDRLLILSVAEPRRHGISRMAMANRLYDRMAGDGGNMVALVAANRPAEWAKAVQARYPAYSVDDTQLKELARGEAALVYISGGKIRWKYNLGSMSPWLDDVSKVSSLSRKNLLCKSTAVFVAVLVLLLAVSLLSARRKGAPESTPEGGSKYTAGKACKNKGKNTGKKAAEAR